MRRAVWRLPVPRRQRLRRTGPPARAVPSRSPIESDCSAARRYSWACRQWATVSAVAMATLSSRAMVRVPLANEADGVSMHRRPHRSSRCGGPLRDQQRGVSTGDALGEPRPDLERLQQRVVVVSLAGVTATSRSESSVASPRAHAPNSAMNTGAGSMARAACRRVSIDRSRARSMSRMNCDSGFSSIKDTRWARPARRRSTTPIRSRSATTLAAPSRLISANRATSLIVRGPSRRTKAPRMRPWG